MKSEEAKRLKQLEDENKRLKQIVADLTLDNKILKHISDGKGKLVSPSRKRAAVEELKSSLGTSERRACAVIDQPRSSQGYQPRKDDEEQPLANRIVELARRQP